MLSFVDLVSRTLVKQSLWVVNVEHSRGNGNQHGSRANGRAWGVRTTPITEGQKRGVTKSADHWRPLTGDEKDEGVVRGGTVNAALGSR